jgi:hypothetical protein
MIRRLARDESGMTMGLAIMMILLIGVMGAGLLTFVSRDLNTVIEENRGQRAFEVADAGIEAAKRQLASGVVRTDYDSVSPDIQWSTAQGGLTLNNLDLDEVGTTSDSVNVTIKYCAKASNDPQCAVAGSPPAVEYFRVISTGTYGDPPQQAKRKIEAIFEGVVPGAGGGNGTMLGHPLYYTKSDIRITHPTVSSDPVYLDQISLFSGQNIMIQGDTSQNAFTLDYGNAMSGAYRNTTTREELCDWNTEVRYHQTLCFQAGTDTWNTVSRSIISPGFAAENKICGLSVGPNVPIDTCHEPGAKSIADGVHGFDSTTGPINGLTGLPNVAGTDLANPQNTRGDGLSFKRKEPLADGTYPPNEDGTISYPFPPLAPKAEAFRNEALKPVNRCRDFDSSTVNCPEPAPDTRWGLTASSTDRIVFIDAGNRTLRFHGGNTSGIMVVWCGRLLQNSRFDGIILNLHGESLPNDTGSSLPGDTDCPDPSTPAATINPADVPYGGTVGTYVNMGDTAGNTGGTICGCWVYADGGTKNVPGPDVAGIEFLPDSTATKRESSSFDCQSDTNFFDTPPPTSFALRNWRELYE